MAGIWRNTVLMSTTSANTFFELMDSPFRFVCRFSVKANEYDYLRFNKTESRIYTELLSALLKGALALHT